VTIESAQPVAAGGGAPGYCRVVGTSRPTKDSEIRFEVAMPPGDVWNGRYLQVGNGGFAGRLPEGEIRGGVAQGFATAGTDDGHHFQSDMTDAVWALDRPEKITDFGYRAIEETGIAARAILEQYAGRPIAHSYFTGCSNGGREALMAAERYPQEFDGIVAGAPAADWTRVLESSAWDVQALSDPDRYLPDDKLRLLEDAAVKACGDSDGVIEEPRSCVFDPGSLLCSGTKKDCLTPAQVTAARLIYGGPKNASTGQAIAPGLEPGTEAERGGWKEWLTGRSPRLDGASHGAFASNFFRYMVFDDGTYDIRRFNFDSDVATTESKLAHILNATNPDLSAFRRRGGKLIVWHGWGDPAVAPRLSTEYFERVRQKMGDTSDFYRLFMAPGLLHCMGGPGADSLETMKAIVAWVEDGQSPATLAATKFSGEGGTVHTAWTRPLCPYPSTAVWEGRGDRSLASTWECVPFKRENAALTPRDIDGGTSDSAK
jgi:feruloyl esterase